MREILAYPVWALELWQWLGLGVGVLVGLGLSQGAEAVVLRLAERAAGLTGAGWDDQLVRLARGPLRYAALALGVGVGSRLLRLPEPVQHPVDVLARTLGLVAVVWLALRLVGLAEQVVEQRLSQSAGEDVGRVRGVRTQLAVLKRIAQAGLYLVGGALVLLQFESVRNLGVSLLASAGLAGLVLGLAAQRSISTLLAGLQLSLTQPMRIGDTVIVEGEWGWVEEITLTYVVIKVWDLRRLIVPMSNFLEKPFQNWSKVSPELLGTVELFVDHRTDVEALRAELRRVLEGPGRELWDGKVQGVQVTGCSERTMTVRPLVSASDAGRLWDLRCLVREQLIAWLRRQPYGLPTLRAEVGSALPGGLEAGTLRPPAPAGHN